MKDDSHPRGRKYQTTVDVDENGDSTSSDDDNLKPKAKASKGDEDYIDESDERYNKEFIESVKSCLVEIRKLPNEGKTQIKHFCAYICRRLDQRTGETYVPTNESSSRITPEMEKEYKAWFLNKIELSRDDFGSSVKSGVAFHWRQYIKTTYRSCNIIKKVMGTLPMFTQWLRHSEKRKKKKITEQKNSGGDGGNTNDNNGGNGVDSNNKDGVDFENNKDGVDGENNKNSVDGENNEDG